MINIYTDGSCNNKTHMNGGIGIVIINTDHQEHFTPHSKGQYINTTSARMEIRAALEALRLIPNKETKIRLYCDNEYVVNAIAKKWVLRWEEENLRYRKNGDLWKQVLEEYRKFINPPDFVWVRGHANEKFNIMCDELAKIASKANKLIDDTEIILS